MSAPLTFGRIAASTGNGTPVVRSARIKAINAQRLAPPSTTATAPVNTGPPSASSDLVGDVPASGRGSRKRSRDSSNDESIAGSEGKDDEPTEAPRAHKKSKPPTDQAEDIAAIQNSTETRSLVDEEQVGPKLQSNQAEEGADVQSPTEARNVTNEGQLEPNPQSDQAEEDIGTQGPTETRSAANEEQPEPKPQSDQAEEVAVIERPAETRNVTDEERVDNKSSLPEADQSFYRAIIAVVMWLRVLDQHRAAQKERSSKISILNRLMDLKRPSMLSAPTEEEYKNPRDKLRSDFERYERNLETRCAQAETAGRDIPHLVESSKARMDRFDGFVRVSATLPDVGCLKGSAEFQAAFERCRFYSRILPEIEDEISGVEHDSNLAHERIDAYASRLATRGLELAGLTATEEPAVPAADLSGNEYSPAQEFQENISTRLARLQELRADLQKTEQSYFEHKENLARIAEKLLIEAGMLQPGAPQMDKPIPAPDNAGPAPEVPEAEEHDADNDAEVVEGRSSPDLEENIFAKRKAKHDALTKELMAAQFHLCDAEKAFKDSRKFTEEELAQLPQNITEDLLGLELKRKLTRTTRNYIDAQNRVKDLQAEGRRLRVPGVDRFPIDQTWDFEDRSDDGYLHSTFPDKVERSKPKVEAWLPQIATSEAPSSPPTWPYISNTVFKLAELRLGDDKMDGFSSEGAKERIARYQKACEDLRNSGQFPPAVPDGFVSTETLPKLGSHMT
jgi:hypothetical protein